MKRRIVVEYRDYQGAGNIGIHLGSAVDDVLERKFARKHDQSSAFGLNQTLAGVQDCLYLIRGGLDSTYSEEPVASEAGSEGPLEISLVQNA